MADILNPVTFYWKQYVEDRPLLGGMIFYGLLTVMIFPILGELVSSNDIFKALYSGRYLWWFGQFPHHSTFTFSPVLEFLPRDSFNWLGNLILLGVFQTTGYTGLQLLRGLIVAVIVGLVHSLFDWDRNPIFLVLLFFVITALGQKLLIRTAMVAAPGLTVLLWIGTAGWDREDRTIYWLFPLVLLVWSQIHGSYQLGAGVLVVFLIGDLSRLQLCSTYNVLRRANCPDFGRGRARTESWFHEAEKYDRSSFNPFRAFRRKGHSIKQTLPGKHR